jgi:hypothetical protein
MADVQIAVIDTTENQVNVAVPGVQGPIGSVAIAQDGTATEPGIRFESDTNTGIYRPGADQLAVSTGGPGRLFVASDGKVGIGTTSPGALLEVDRGGGLVRSWTPNAATYGIFIGGGTNYFSLVGDNGADLLFGSGTSQFLGRVRYENSTNALSLWTNNTERARIDSSGRLLVGTSSTVTNGQGDARFQVTSNSSSYYAADFGHFSNDAFSGAVYFKKSRSTTAGGFASVVDSDLLGDIRFAGADGAAYIRAATIECRVNGTPGTGVMPGCLIFSTTPSASGTPTERMRLDSSGRLGLGTTIPATTLDVNGDVTITDKIIHGGDTNTAIRFPAADTVSVETAGSERARIDTSGRLLVGTSTAAQYNSYSSTMPVQIAGTGDTDIQLTSFRNDVFAGGINFSKSRATTVGVNTVVQNNDKIGGVRFFGADGTNWINAGLIECLVDGTPGANDMPGRLVFSVTADGASSPTEALRISNNRAITVSDGGNVVLGTTTGTKIGTATSQKIGFYNATPVVQPTAVADATDAATVITQLNALLTRMRNLGLIAT